MTVTTDNMDPTDKIYALAADWVALEQSETISADEKAELHRWLEEDPLHFIAYERMQNILQRTEFLDENMLDNAQETASSILEEHSTRPPAFSGNYFGMAAIAAGIFSIAVLSMLYFNLSPDIFETKVGEQHTMVLEDGSRIYLNALSSIEVDYQSEQRFIQLVDGEVLFEVAHDPDRPFIVQAGAVAVKALGTKFNVSSRLAETTVTVLEGKINVTPTEGGLDNPVLQSSPPPVLTVGEQISYSNGSLTEVMPVDVNRVIAWREGRIYIERRPLSDLVFELNRHFPGRITIKDTELASMDVNVNLRLQDKATTFRMLEQMLQVRIITTSEGNASIIPGNSN